MTKKNYELIARAIRKSLISIRSEYTDYTETAKQNAEAGIWESVLWLRYELKNDNPRFDDNKFVEAIETD